MTEHTEQTTAQPGAVPTRIELESFIEAVTRGVARALAAAEDEDEVSGYLQLDGSTYPPTRGPVVARPPIMVGLMLPPPSGPVYPGDPLNSLTSKMGL